MDSTSEGPKVFAFPHVAAAAAVVVAALSRKGGSDGRKQIHLSLAVGVR